MESSNPVIGNKFTKSYSNTSSGVMTLNGTVNKSLLLLGITMLSTIIFWALSAKTGLGGIFSIASIVIGLGMVFYISYNPEKSPTLAPIYAVVEGMFLGPVSMFFESAYQNIVIQAILITGAVFISMLYMYKSNIITVNEKYKRIVIGATIGIFVVYIISFIANLFGVEVPYLHSNGIIGIGINLFVVGIAALNLGLDFDLIERGIENKSPSYMEWYAGFALLVTVVWLYIEILRLLSKLRSSNN